MKNKNEKLIEIGLKPNSPISKIRSQFLLVLSNH